MWLFAAHRTEYANSQSDGRHHKQNATHNENEASALWKD